jgi:hypothetical protein
MDQSLCMEMSIRIAANNFTEVIKRCFNFCGYRIQWYLGIRPLWNKSNLVYVLFGRENFCLVYDLVWNTTRVLELV